MQAVDDVLSAVNAVLWHDIVLLAILGAGILFTIWTGFAQYHALTHGVRVIRGRYDSTGGPGAITHVQALSAALSATVGLGNIGGVALAISLGGPGAVFWMWVVGFIGMAIKTVEVTLAMLYRDTTDGAEPHGGAMWVSKRAFAAWSPRLAGTGVVVGGLFCVTLLVSTFTGGNMFQAWNVAVVTDQSFGVPGVVTGVILTVLVGLVIIGGIKRIGSVAEKIVPAMCGLYLLAGLYVLVACADRIPEMLRLIVASAFGPADASGAFLGGTFGYAFLWGMKRALFSNEAGQGSSPIAHAAARTSEPVREGVVAGLEPFIDTLVVCTITALVILCSGAWNRGPTAELAALPPITAHADGRWQMAPTPLPDRAGGWPEGEHVLFAVARVPSKASTTLVRVDASVTNTAAGYVATWEPIASNGAPVLRDGGVFTHYAGAALTSHAFDRVQPGLGTWLVSIAVWLFAISTMISWSYYGEQGAVFLLGRKSVLPYRILYCALIFVSCIGIIKTDEALDAWTGLGTGVMLLVNLPLTLLFGGTAVRAYRRYIRRVRAGAFDSPRT